MDSKKDVLEEGQCRVGIHENPPSYVPVDEHAVQAAVRVGKMHTEHPLEMMCIGIPPVVVGEAVVAVRVLVRPDGRVAHGEHRDVAQGVVEPREAPRYAVVQALVAEGARHQPGCQAQGEGSGVGAVAEAVPVDGRLHPHHGQTEEEEGPAHGDAHVVLREIRPTVAAERLLFLLFVGSSGFVGAMGSVEEHTNIECRHPDQTHPEGIADVRHVVPRAHRHEEGVTALRLREARRHGGRGDQELGQQLAGLVGEGVVALEQRRAVPAPRELQRGGSAFCGVWGVGV